ncbi:MAG: hypothetical protein BSR46_09425 [Candidatus Dactylopiibacterium carminicum]|nr:MAG: hypothetical protein BSR46_09425 [Candidatus Dactylopiibacterium carminicum]
MRRQRRGDPATRVLFVSTGLGVGGAERALEQLLPRLAAQGLSVAVVSLREPQPVGARLRALGIAVHELGMAPSQPSPAGLWRLWRVVRDFRPDLIQGWMYHGNVAAHLARLATPRARVLPGIHQTLARLELESLATRAVIRLDAWFSSLAARVLYVAETARIDHEAAGYARRGVVLPNGVDAARFRPDAEARQQLRATLGIDGSVFLVALVGRFHPAKNHAGFLRAAAIVAGEAGKVHFLLAGSGISADNPELAPLLQDERLRGRLHVLGPREDVPRLFAASDLFVLSSIQEALPNVVMEAMSCGLPGVVTDVGDAARMIGDSGWCVAPGDDEALADAILLAYGEDAAAFAARGRAARGRVLAQFDADAVAARYVALYCGLLTGRVQAS